jgi:hypothetical protein
MLKQISIAAAILVAVLLLAPSQANAQVRFGVSIGTPVYTYPVYPNYYYQPYAAYPYYRYPYYSNYYVAPRYYAPYPVYRYREVYKYKHRGHGRDSRVEFRYRR